MPDCFLIILHAWVHYYSAAGMHAAMGLATALYNVPNWCPCMTTWFSRGNLLYTSAFCLDC